MQRWRTNFCLVCRSDGLSQGGAEAWRTPEMATGHLSLLEVLSIWILVASKMDGRSSSSTHKVDVLTCKKHRQAGKKWKVLFGPPHIRTCLPLCRESLPRKAFTDLPRGMSISWFQTKSSWQPKFTTTLGTDGLKTRKFTYF